MTPRASELLKKPGPKRLSKTPTRRYKRRKVVKPLTEGQAKFLELLNASYRGLASPRVEWLANDGRILAPRALSKVRNDERGTAYVLEQMRSMGAPDRLPFESGRDYVTRALRSGAFRSRRHPGNHAYTFWLDRNRRAPTGARLAYPKPAG